MKIVVDNYIRINRDSIPDDWLEPLLGLVSVPNEEKEIAIKEHTWGAKSLPDRIYLGGEVDGEIILPRGFLTELIERLEKSNTEYALENGLDKHTSSTSPRRHSSNITLRENQKIAVKNILDNKQGIVNGSTGFGKTVVGLAAANKVGMRTLILVDKISLAKQWQERAKEYFDIDMGLIGGGEWRQEQFTVATFQSIRSSEITNNAWYDGWDFVIHDEQHHVTAESYFDIVNKFRAPYRIGLSATIGKSPAKKKIAELTFGPVIFEDMKIKDKPIVKRVDTDFEFDFQGTSKIGNRVIRNNYSSLLKELVNDRDRNNLIVENIVKDPEAAHIVFSKRLGQLKELQALIEATGSSLTCLMYTGDKSLEEREKIEQRAAEGACVVLSTLADEGMDIPRLDRIHLPFPTKDAETVKQQVGRGLRKHPEKSECIVYDYVDSKCGVLENQWRKRLNGYYRKYEIDIT